jgi:hypothetical protein
VREDAQNLVDVCVILLAGDRALNHVGTRALKPESQPSETVLRFVFPTSGISFP